MKVSARISTNGLSINCEGDATIEHADLAWQELYDLVIESDSVVHLDVSAITRIDVTFIQILFELDRLCRSRGGRLLVSTLPTNHPICKTAQLLGFQMEQGLTLVSGNS